VLTGLIASLVGLPLLGAVSVAVVSRRATKVSLHCIVLTTTGLTGLCALGLLPSLGGRLAIAAEWLPGTGPLGLSVGAKGLYASLVTTWAAFLATLGAPRSDVQRHPLSGALTLLALAAANVAFLADHFLLRYVALEVAALCVAAAPLAEVRGRAAMLITSSNYLILRLGDAALLAAMLLLMGAADTLRIEPALEAVGELDALRLGWIAAAFVVAVWVKVGGWPFHLWSQSGRRLDLATRSWLYATLMPNLGLYLLYRVTPLLMQSGPVRVAAVWIGAGAAVLATLLALSRTDPSAALAYIGAGQGGLALFLSGCGLDSVVWLGLLIMTPLRLLLALAGDTVRSTGSPARRRVAVCLFGLGGLALAAFGLLGTWWADETGAPPVAVTAVGVMVALTAIWAGRAAWQLSVAQTAPQEARAVSRTRWMTLGLLGAGTLIGVLCSGPMIHYLASAAGLALGELPTVVALGRFAASVPVLVAAAGLALAVQWLQQRSRAGRLVSAVLVDEAHDAGEGLVRPAQALRAVVETKILEQMSALVARTVAGGAQLVHGAVERNGLESILRRIVQIVVDGAQLIHRVVEQGGLEGILYRSVQVVVGGARLVHGTVEQAGFDGMPRRTQRIVLAVSRRLQRWHLGRLRRNLLWVAASLALVILILMLGGW